MLAELYIRSLYDRQHKKWEPFADKAVEERDKLTRGTREFYKADAVVADYYDLMHLSYFPVPPDSQWDVLWEFDLAWQTDVFPLVHDNHLSVPHIQKLLGMLDERQDRFYVNTDIDGTHYYADYCTELVDELRSFLAEAVELGEPIEWRAVTADGHT